MIGYVTMRTNDLERAVAFYDALLVALGIKRMWVNERRAAWGDPRFQALLVTKPYDGQRAAPGNGTMTALLAHDPGVVTKVHATALALGAKEEGAPDSQPEPSVHWGFLSQRQKSLVLCDDINIVDAKGNSVSNDQRVHISWEPASTRANSIQSGRKPQHERRPENHMW